MKIAAAFVLLFGAVSSADGGLKLQCRVVVPREYRPTSFDPPPNGEPEPIRYTVAYEAFWWNCVSVRAADLRARCPFVSSGTPAAAEGAMEGATNAGHKIDQLLEKYPVGAVRRYLRSIASQPVAKEKMRPYFAKPTPERLK